MSYSIQEYHTNRSLIKAILEAESIQSRLEWSAQGLGMLRLYLDPDKKLRLHIWDRRLQIADASPLHDHPWHFQSLVIAGNVKQFRFRPVNDSDLMGTPIEWYNQATIKCGEGAHCTSETKEVQLVRLPFELYPAGSSYTQKKSEIHESLADHGSVTLVQRSFEGNRDSAHIYWAGKGPWVDAEPRPATTQEVNSACSYALRTWF